MHKEFDLFETWLEGYFCGGSDTDKRHLTNIIEAYREYTDGECGDGSSLLTGEPIPGVTRRILPLMPYISYNPPVCGPLAECSRWEPRNRSD